MKWERKKNIHEKDMIFIKKWGKLEKEIKKRENKSIFMDKFYTLIICSIVLLKCFSKSLLKFNLSGEKSTSYSRKSVLFNTTKNLQ